MAIYSNKLLYMKNSAAGERIQIIFISFKQIMTLHIFITLDAFPVILNFTNEAHLIFLHGSKVNHLCHPQMDCSFTYK